MISKKEIEEMVESVLAHGGASFTVRYLLTKVIPELLVENDLLNEMVSMLREKRIEELLKTDPIIYGIYMLWNNAAKKREHWDSLLPPVIEESSK